MSTYDAEEEQTVEAIQGWLRKYGTTAAVSLVVFIGGYLGWEYYQNNQLSQLGDVSSKYSTVMSDLNAKGAAEQSNVQAFIDQNSSSSYAVLASLTLAKYLVDENKLDEAQAQLQWASSNNKDKTLEALIINRLARVLMALEQYQEAIDQLSSVQDSAWQARNQELIGDIYILQGNSESALTAYQNAKNAEVDLQQLSAGTLQMKLDDLAK